MKNKFKKIGPYIDQLTGFPFESSKFKQSGKVRLLRGINISRGFIRFDFDNEIFWEDSAEELKKFVLKENDIVVSMDGSLVGRNFAKIPKFSIPTLLVQRVARLRCKDELYQDYLYQWIASDFFVRYVDSVKTSSGIPHISSKQINDFEILFLPKPEQIKIAKILSAFDKAINGLTLIIAAKEKRKKGLMQNLLTGEVRFKEFKKEKWKKQKLGDCLNYIQPTQFLVKNTEYSNSHKTPVLTAGKTFILGYTNETFGIFKEGLPVIIFDDFTTTSQYVDFPFKAKSSAMKILSAKNDFNIKFIYEAMQLIKYKIGGHERHWISKFSQLTILVPAMNEQNKIASVLSVCDKEILSLKNKLKKLKKQKQGLMQELLTGKRRVKV